MTREPTYPRREPFFAFRFIRLLGKTCAAQTLGTEGVWLLTTIATTEDAARYKGPVTFYNAPLLSILGFATWRRLEKVRDRAVEAGWLVYIPAPKGSRLPGKYFVQIPAEFQDLQDTPISENWTSEADQASDPSICQTGILSDTSNQVQESTICHGDISTDISSDISTDISFYPIPNPTPKSMCAHSDGVSKSTPRKRRMKARWDPIVEEIYEAFPRKGSRKCVLQLIERAIRSGVDAGELLEKVRQFARMADGADQPEFIKTAKGWMTNDCWRDDPNEWATGHSRRNQPNKQAFAKHDSDLMPVIDG